MPLTSIGDLAQTFIIQRANARLNRTLSDLGTELTTGLRTDKRNAVTGDVGLLAALERSVTGLKAITASARESAVFAEATQAALSRIQDTVQDLTPTLLVIQPGTGGTVQPSAFVQARNAFEATVSSLSGAGAGGYIFSGIATGTPPLRAAADTLADLQALVAGAPDAATVNGLIDAYFGPGGGFETTDYLGATQDLAARQISEDDSVAVGLRADADVMRQTLAGLAKVAVLGSGVLAGSGAERQGVIDAAVGDLLAADTGLTFERASVGAAQARIDRAITGNAAQATALDQARVSLIGIDPYETATRIEQTQLQLESLYTLTARMSRLSLTNYL